MTIKDIISKIKNQFEEPILNEEEIFDECSQILNSLEDNEDENIIKMETI